MRYIGSPMSFYYSTFIVAFVLLALAVAVAYAPEIKDFMQRRRRLAPGERHLVKHQPESGPRPPRPNLRRASPPEEEQETAP